MKLSSLATGLLITAMAMPVAVAKQDAHEEKRMEQYKEQIQENKEERKEMHEEHKEQKKEMHEKQHKEKQDDGYRMKGKK